MVRNLQEVSDPDGRSEQLLDRVADISGKDRPEAAMRYAHDNGVFIRLQLFRHPFGRGVQHFEQH